MFANDFVFAQSKTNQFLISISFELLFFDLKLIFSDKFMDSLSWFFFLFLEFEFKSNKPNTICLWIEIANEYATKMPLQSMFCSRYIIHLYPFDTGKIFFSRSTIFQLSSNELWESRLYQHSWFQFVEKMFFLSIVYVKIRMRTRSNEMIQQ